MIRKIKRLLSAIVKPRVTREDAAELMVLIGSYDKAAKERKKCVDLRAELY